MGNKKKKMIVIELNPEKEIGFTVTDGATNKVLKTGSSKVKDLDLSSKSKGGVTKAKDGKSVKTEKVILKSGTGINSLLKLKEILTPSKKSRGGATKAKYGKMMKASHGSMVSTEGSTKSRGNGIALRGTKFKGVF